MDRFENMSVFIKVVENGSISRAADKLGVAKSAVSRRLKELEEHLGVELFHRTTRKMNLTESGRTFYHQSIRILDDVMEAELSTSQAHGTLKGTLKIALPSTFGLMHMAPAINDFIKKHPNITCELDFNDREVDLIQEGFDLAIRIANLPDSSLIARRLSSINFVICASPSYLNTKGEPQTSDELNHHQCLVYSLLKDTEHWQLSDHLGNSSKTKIHPTLKSSSGEYLKNAAIDGLGIALLPTFIVHKEIEQGLLKPILKTYQTNTVQAYAIYPHTRYLSQRVRTLIDFLVDRFEGTPYWDECLNKSQ